MYEIRIFPYSSINEESKSILFIFIVCIVETTSNSFLLLSYVTTNNFYFYQLWVLVVSSWFSLFSVSQPWTTGPSVGDFPTPCKKLFNLKNQGLRQYLYKHLWTISWFPIQMHQTAGYLAKPANKGIFLVYFRLKWKNQEL